MKNLILLFALLMTTFSCSLAQKTALVIPAGQSVEIDYPDLDVYNVEFSNKGKETVEVSVISKQSGDQVRGFGLDKKGKADINIEAENMLVLTNPSFDAILVKMNIRESSREVLSKTGKYVSFTLVNTTKESIPLLIPSVMNPNLSPMSRSGVDLKMGQEILFRSEGKKYVLLTVDESIEDGSSIDVHELIEKRKAAADRE